MNYQRGLLSLFSVCSEVRITPHHENGLLHLHLGWCSIFLSETAETLAAARVSGVASFSATLVGPSGATRTPGLLIPNLSGKLFLLVYSDFQPFSICFTYSLTLLSPLFPGVPAPSVVIYVVKNASRPVSGELSPVPDGKRFSLLLAAL